MARDVGFDREEVFECVGVVNEWAALTIEESEARSSQDLLQKTRPFGESRIEGPLSLEPTGRELGRRRACL